MNQSIKKLSFYILTLISTSTFSLKSTTIEIIFPINQPLLLANTDVKTINALCEVHVASKQTISIKIIRGNGSFNGTTFSQGDTLTSTVYDMQHVPISATPGTYAQVTNLGPYVLKALC